MTQVLTTPKTALGILTKILRCPICRTELEFRDNLRCRGGHTFPVEDGVPILSGPESATEEMQHSHQRDFYNREYGEFRAYRLEHWESVYVKRVTSMWGNGGPPGFYLDVGAGGSGYTVIESARRGAIAVGCDISLNGMKSARRFADGEGVGERCLFIVCDSERLPFADEAFATTAAIAVLEHVPDDLKAISEIARVTRKGGQVFLAVPNALDRMPLLLRGLYARHDRRIGHLRHYSAKDLTTVCRGVGLRASKIVYSAHWVKVWQLLFHVAAKRLRLDDTRLWWWLERFDARAASSNSGMHVNTWLERV